MNKSLQIGLVVLGVCLAGGKAWAQGLSATRPVRVYPYYSPFDVLYSQQAIQAQRDAERREVQEQAAAARQASLAEREAEIHAAGQAAAAAQRAASARATASRDAHIQSAWAAYHAQAERRHAQARERAAMPTDLVASDSGTPNAASSSRTMEAVSPAVRAARAAIVRTRFQRPELFTKAWMDKQAGAWRPDKWAATGDRPAWQTASWPTMYRWLSWTPDPMAYEFGTYVVYQDGQVLYAGQPLATAEDFYQQAVSFAQAGATGDKPGDEWLPLGVFALVQGDQADPSAVVQLAVNKAGLVRGNHYSFLTDNVLPIRGKADAPSQRFAGTVGDKKDIVFEVGMYNLTLDEAPVLIHLSKDYTQQWLLARLVPPPETPAAAKPQPPAAEDQAAAEVVVRVPSDAAVWFSGHRTNLAGPERVFGTPPLEKGQTYAYQVRARWTENGQPVEQTRRVQVRAGERAVVEFR